MLECSRLIHRYACHGAVVWLLHNHRSHCVHSPTQEQSLGNDSVTVDVNHELTSSGIINGLMLNLCADKKQSSANKRQNNGLVHDTADPIHQSIHQSIPQSSSQQPLSLAIVTLTWSKHPYKWDGSP